VSRSSLSYVTFVLASLLPAHAENNNVSLKSFGYMSLTLPCDGKDQLLAFDPNHNWKMAPGFAAPGAGKFPDGNFYLRRVAISHAIQGDTGGSSYAVIGHSGPNGDWVSPMIVGTGNAQISFDADAAPLFSAGEYFDLHASCAPAGRWHWPGHRPMHWGSASFWYTPAPSQPK
jgi:hypothetical protein